MDVVLHPTYRGKVRVQTEEIVTVANKSSYNIPDKLNLVDKYKILGISVRAYHVDRKSLQTGAALVNDAVLKSSHLHLKDAKRNEFFQVPLEYAVSDLTGYKTALWFQEPMSVNLAESIIECKAVGSISAGQVYEVTIWVADNEIC